jgi:hypothetical protein
MPDPTPAPEIKPKPMPEVVKTATASAPPPEKAQQSKPTTEQPTGASRKTLEAIAAGKPVAEATKPVENLPNRETVTALLNEANILLLDTKDMRLLTNGLATQAADTPLGNEVRLDALRTLTTVDGTGLQPDLANQLTQLQEKIAALKLPEPKPEASATLTLLTQFNEQHPENAIPADVLEAVKTGKRDASSTIAQMLQTNPDLAQMTWKELTGVEGFGGLTPSPEVMLDLAGIPKSPENVQKALEIFGVVKPMKEPSQLGEKLYMGAMYGALFIMFFTQLATGEQQGGGH